MNIVKAVIQNDVKEVTEYLVSGQNPNYYEDFARVTLLHHAVVNHAYEVAELLIRFGAKMLRERSNNETPLDFAKSCIDKKMIKILQKKNFLN